MIFGQQLHSIWANILDGGDRFLRSGGRVSLVWTVANFLVIYFLSWLYFDSIHLDVLTSKDMMILYASSII